MSIYESSGFLSNLHWEPMGLRLWFVGISQESARPANYWHSFLRCKPSMATPFVSYPMPARQKDQVNNPKIPALYHMSWRFHGTWDRSRCWVEVPKRKEGSDSWGVHKKLGVLKCVEHHKEYIFDLEENQSTQQHLSCIHANRVHFGFAQHNGGGDLTSNAPKRISFCTPDLLRLKTVGTQFIHVWACLLWVHSYMTLILWPISNLLAPQGLGK